MRCGPLKQIDELLFIVGNDNVTVNCYIDDLISKSFKFTDLNPKNVRSLDFAFDSWNTFEEIEDYLRSLDDESVHLESIGKSHEKRDIWRLKIGLNAEDMPSMVIDCGIHAREWVSPAFCLYLIDQLLNESSFMTGLNWINGKSLRLVLF